VLGEVVHNNESKKDPIMSTKRRRPGWAWSVGFDEMEKPVEIPPKKSRVRQTFKHQKRVKIHADKQKEGVFRGKYGGPGLQSS